MSAGIGGEVHAANGTRFFISSAPVDKSIVTATQFAALTYTEIGLTETAGEYGDESSEINFTSLGDGRVRKAKGPRNAGMLNLVVGDDPLDAGQLALKAAQLTNFKYAIKAIYPDRPNPTGTDSVEYMRVLVMSQKKNVGDATNVMRRTYALNIDSAIVEVPATAGS